MDPGIEGGFAAETADRFVGFGKNILEEIVRVLVIRGHVVDQPVKAWGVFHHQLVERTGIAILRTRDQLLVFIRSWLVHGPFPFLNIRTGNRRRSEERRVGEEGRSRWSPY